VEPAPKAEQEVQALPTKPRRKSSSKKSSDEVELIGTDQKKSTGGGLLPVED